MNMIMAVRFPLLMFILCGLVSLIAGLNYIMWLQWMMLPPAVLWTLDIKMRLDDYTKTLKIIRTDMGRVHAWAKYKRGSMCERHAVIAAGYEYDELLGECIKNKYRSMGYRWYHITPDQPLWTIKFWKGFFSL